MGALRSFACVVECSSFSKAARLVGLSVSTVSKHVETIETRLRTTLLLRTTRRVSLTEAGKLFHEQCKSLLKGLDDMVEASLLPGELRGRLRIVSPPSFTSCILSPALPSFLQRHPLLRVELKVTTSYPDFLQDGIDVAIRMTPGHTNDQTERVGRAPSVLCASPAYLVAHGSPTKPEDLHSHRCLGGISSPYSERWRFMVGNQALELPISSNFLCDTGDVLREACLQGLGIAGFYEFHVKSYIKAGHLVPLLTAFQADVSSIHLVRPSARYCSPMITAFSDFIREVWRETNGED